ncbi:hypothetical protein ACFVU3_19480 [Streptomyces sp. NPDC058052]|uniref:hypothetical protein n=1 Tax=Streptomyces sp. NPDC058052 TaxID=3346316 RepID=UPI0036E22C75
MFTQVIRMGGEALGDEVHHPRQQLGEVVLRDAVVQEEGSNREGHRDAGAASGEVLGGAADYLGEGFTVDLPVDVTDVQSLLHLRLARAHAAQGEKRETLRALSAAEHLLGTSSTRPLPAWCSWLSEADLAVDSGQCLLDLGETARAHHLIAEGRELLPTTRDKTRGVFLAYQAASHLKSKEPELAAQAADEALRLARRIGAPRCEKLVQDLVPDFERVRTAEGVDDLLMLVAA